MSQASLMNDSCGGSQDPNVNRNVNKEGQAYTILDGLKVIHVILCQKICLHFVHALIF
jgi:hypothetical protein